MSNELIDLARDVLTNYDIKVASMRVTQSGGIKTVWRIDTSDTVLCLKRLKQPLDKALFSIKAQDYLSQKGAKVPAIVPSKNGELYTVSDNQVFVVYQWVTGKNLSLDNRTQLEKATYGIAEFHLASTGYQPPENSSVSSKLGRWPHHYNSMLNRFMDWQETAKKSSENPLSRVFLANVDRNIKLGEKAVAMLNKSCYMDWVNKSESQKILCHQDYGDGNALLTPEGVYVIDLDGVTFDLPVRDLRKIINKRMATIGKWDEDLLKSIIKWYCKVNPLTRDQLEVLFIDLLFPHEFHDTAKNPYRKNKPISAEKLARVAKLEQDKEKILESVLSGLT